MFRRIPMGFYTREEKQRNTNIYYLENCIRSHPKVISLNLYKFIKYVEIMFFITLDVDHN